MNTVATAVPLIEKDVPLAPLTTLKVGGTADYYAAVTTQEELETAVRFAEKNALPLFVLGGGSNTLASDDGFRGLVLHIKNSGYIVRDISTDEVEVTVAAGESLDAFVADTVAKGWWGLENLSHIPGTVGATPVQNVGAYGVEVADRIESVVVYDAHAHEQKIFSAVECAFGYRDSIFKSKRTHPYIILSVTFRLSKIAEPRIGYADLQKYFLNEPAPSQLDIRAAIIAIRSQKFPDWSIVGTAGSFFKNPIVASEVAHELKLQYPELPMYPAIEGYTKVSLGYILDKICHLKGYTENHVGLYHAQALVLVATHGATSSEIKMFARDVQKKVFAKTNIEIEFEVTQI